MRNTITATIITLIFATILVMGMSTPSSAASVESHTHTCSLDNHSAVSAAHLQTTGTTVFAAADDSWTCTRCSGSGNCWICSSTGKTTSGDDCSMCKGTGKCYYCNGKGTI